MTMTREQVLALSVTIDLLTTADALGIGRGTVYQMACTGTYPIRLYRVGQRYRATRADLLQVLGIPDEPAAAPGPAARTAPDPSAPATATGPGTKERREEGVWRGAA